MYDHSMHCEELMSRELQLRKYGWLPWCFLTGNVFQQRYQKPQGVAALNVHREGLGPTQFWQRKNMEVADDGRISPSGNLDLSRERSNSDPGRREKTIVMNGGNTVPTRRAPTFLNATEVGVSTPVAGANSSPSTPPPVRRSKRAINIGRLFRPWKWRRRKKSQKFITTSQSKKLLILCCCNRIDRFAQG